VDCSSWEASPKEKGNVRVTSPRLQGFKSHPLHHYDEILEGFVRVMLKSTILDSMISKTLLIWIAIYLKYGKNQ
jgi:hypothetical protein